MYKNSEKKRYTKVFDVFMPIRNNFAFLCLLFATLCAIFA